jgi:ATP synthase protein I
MMIAALGSFTIKILVLIFLSAKFSNTTAFNGKLFGLTAIVCVLVWTFAQVIVSMKLKVLYVEPDGER